MAWYVWDISTVKRLLISIILVIGTPALSDLIKTYDQYKKDYENIFDKHNNKE